MLLLLTLHPLSASSPRRVLCRGDLFVSYMREGRSKEHLEPPPGWSKAAWDPPNPNQVLVRHRWASFSFLSATKNVIFLCERTVSDHSRGRRKRRRRSNPCLWSFYHRGAQSHQSGPPIHQTLVGLQAIPNTQSLGALLHELRFEQEGKSGQRQAGRAASWRHSEVVCPCVSIVRAAEELPSRMAEIARPLSLYVSISLRVA